MPFGTTKESRRQRKHTKIIDIKIQKMFAATAWLNFHKSLRRQGKCPMLHRLMEIGATEGRDQ